MTTYCYLNKLYRIRAISTKDNVLLLQLNTQLLLITLIHRLLARSQAKHLAKATMNASIINLLFSVVLMMIFTGTIAQETGTYEV